MNNWAQLVSTKQMLLKFIINEPGDSISYKFACAPSEDSGQPGPEVLKPFSCSTQLSMKFALQIKFKLLTFANIFLSEHS